MQFTRIMFITLALLLSGIMKSYGQESDSECPHSEDSTSISGDGFILLNNNQLVTGNGEILIPSEELPTNFSLFFDSLEQRILFWSRNDDQAEVNQTGFEIRVWDFESEEFVVSNFVVPHSFRPVNWLANSEFLFEDWETNSLVTFSVETQELSNLLQIENVPSMRLVPVSFAVDYDMRVSSNQQYLAYENEAINRGIAIWDIEEEIEIATFTNDESLPLESNPTWSNSSQQLAFANYVDTEMQVFLYDVEASEQIQLSDFDSYPDDIEMGRPWSTIQDLKWSTNDNYLAISNSFLGIQIFDIQGKMLRDTCVTGTPVFWWSDTSLVISTDDGIFVIDAENNILNQLDLVDGILIAWIP